MNQEAVPQAQILTKLRQFKRDPSLGNLKDIVPHTTSDDAQIRELAISVATGTIKSSLLESYHEIEPGVRRGLVTLLEKINPDVVSLMREEIYSPDIYRRVRAVQILGLVGKKRRIEEYLKEMIRDSDEKIRATVIRALGEMVDRSEASILLALLNDFDERVRANTIEALETLQNKNLIGIISRYRNDRNNRIRGNALKALWNMGVRDIGPSLQDMLSNDDENMRASGAWVIGELGANDSSFVQYVKEVQYSDSVLVRNNVIRALLKMDPSVSRMYLSSLFDDSEILEVKELYRME